MFNSKVCNIVWSTVIMFCILFFRSDILKLFDDICDVEDGLVSLKQAESRGKIAALGKTSI